METSWRRLIAVASKILIYHFSEIIIYFLRVNNEWKKKLNEAIIHNYSGVQNRG